MSPLAIKSIVEDVHAGEMSVGYGTDMICDLYVDTAFYSRVREILFDVNGGDMSISDAVDLIEELM